MYVSNIHRESHTQMCMVCVFTILKWKWRICKRIVRMNSAKWRNDVIAHHVASSKLHKHKTRSFRSKQMDVVLKIVLAFQIPWEYLGCWDTRELQENRHCNPTPVLFCPRTDHSVITLKLPQRCLNPWFCQGLAIQESTFTLWTHQVT